MSDPDSTPTKPIPNDIGAETAATEPIAPHVPFAGVEPSTAPSAAPPPRRPRNWAWVVPAIVLVVIAATGVTLAALGAFNQQPAPVVQSPTSPPTITPSSPVDTVDDPDAPAETVAPPAEQPTQPPAPEPTEEPTPEPTEPEPTPEPTP